MNKVILSGRLVGDSEVKILNNGSVINNFVIAVPKRDREERPNYLKCVAFGKTGETIANYLQKGNLILIEGSINQSLYEDKEGNVKESISVMVDKFEFMNDNTEYRVSKPVQGNKPIKKTYSKR